MNNLQILMMNNVKYGPSLTANNGYIYNGWAARHANFCPPNWFVPTNSVFQTLAESLAGGEYKETGTSHWISPNTGANGNTQFNAFGSGYRTKAGIFQFVAQWFSMLYWNSGATLFRSFNLVYNSANWNTGADLSNNYGGSIRLAYSGPIPVPTTVTDYDGNVYDVVTVRGISFTKQNWKCTRLNNGTLIPLVNSDSEWASTTSPARCAYDNNINYV